MTGLWQVSGRNELSHLELCRLDYLYVASWSFWWDMQILWQTPATHLQRARRLLSRAGSAADPCAGQRPGRTSSTTTARASRKRDGPNDSACRTRAASGPARPAELVDRRGDGPGRGLVEEDAGLALHDGVEEPAPPEGGGGAAGRRRPRPA